jgi:hypothetical protein
VPFDSLPGGFARFYPLCAYFGEISIHREEINFMELTIYSAGWFVDGQAGISQQPTSEKYHYHGRN